MTNVLVAKASSYLGTKGRPNTFTRWYSERHGDAYLSAAWCAMFLSYCAFGAKVSKEVGEYAYCPSWVNHFKDAKQWHTTPKVGAVAFMDWDNDGVADHVEVVQSVDGRNIYSIGGNVGGGEGAVKRSYRHASDILGYGYPVYPTVKPATKTHTVVAGDTLSSIADHYYGDPDKWRDIYAKNKKLIGSNPALIKPGQKLALP
jgi:nucleoid-associated protein YgaU